MALNGSDGSKKGGGVSRTVLRRRFAGLRRAGIRTCNSPINSVAFTIQSQPNSVAFAIQSQLVWSHSIQSRRDSNQRCTRRHRRSCRWSLWRRRSHPPCREAGGGQFVPTTPAPRWERTRSRGASLQGKTHLPRFCSAFPMFVPSSSR
jgi:hypothetical protein